MKLVEKYMPKKLPENAVYTEYQCLFHEIFCDNPDVILENTSLSGNNFYYNEIDKEKFFYENIYINLWNKNATINKQIDGYKYDYLNR